MAKDRNPFLMRFIRLLRIGKSANWRKWIVWFAAVFIFADILIIARMIALVHAENVQSGPPGQTAESRAYLAVTDEQPQVTSDAIQESAYRETTEETTIETTTETTGETSSLTSESILETADEKPIQTTAGKPARETTAVKPTDLITLADQWNQDTTEEQALFLFHSIDTICDLEGSRSLIENTDWGYKYQSQAFTGLNAERGVTYYSFCECFDSGLFELRLCNIYGGGYRVIESKALPAGYDAREAYDRYMTRHYPKECISRATLAQIMQTGYLAPFICGTSATIKQGVTWRSDDGQIIGWQLYIPEDKTCIFIYEDHQEKMFFYAAWQLPDIRMFMQGPFSEKVPLNEAANLQDYHP